jgi:hypothetical protein
LVLKLLHTETEEEKVVAKVDVSLDLETEEKVDVAASVSEIEEKHLEAEIALSVEAVLATAKKAAADLVIAKKDLEILLPVQSVHAKRT